MHPEATNFALQPPSLLVLVLDYASMAVTVALSVSLVAAGLSVLTILWIGAPNLNALPLGGFRAMTTEIRAAAPEDASVLAELSKPVQDLHIASRPAQFKPTRVEEVQDWFASMLAKPTVAAWIAHVDGHAAAYLLSVTYERPENPFCLPRAYCEIDQVCVAPQYRRRGVATALFDAVFAHARQVPLESVQLSCWSFNEVADAAFRAMGFREITGRFERKL